MANNKYCGNVSDYQPVLEDASRVVISYGLTELSDGKAEWYEVVFYKKQGKPSFDAAKKAILADINARTDAKIISGFVWTPEGGDPIPVWLSEENQRNFSEAQRIAASMPQAILPVTFKLGEQADETPIYHTFETAEELTAFYLQAVAYINAMLAEGWQEKDSIDWTPYAEALQPVTENTEESGTKKTTRKK
jgi:hypothetical protein